MLVFHISSTDSKTGGTVQTFSLKHGAEAKVIKGKFLTVFQTFCCRWKKGVSLSSSNLMTSMSLNHLKRVIQFPEILANYLRYHRWSKVMASTQLFR